MAASDYVTGLQVTMIGLTTVFMVLLLIAGAVRVLDWTLAPRPTRQQEPSRQQHRPGKRGKESPEPQDHGARPQVVAAIVAAIAAYRQEQVPRFRVAAVTAVPSVVQRPTIGSAWIVASRLAQVNRGAVLVARRRAGARQHSPGVPPRSG